MQNTIFKEKTMKYSLKKQDGVVTATFTVSAEEWAEAMEQAYQKNKSKYSVQGFRKGHAPKKVIEAVYGSTLFEDLAFDDVVEKQLNEFYDKEKSLVIVDRPVLTSKTIDAKGLKYVVTIAIKPEVTLGEYKGITINKDKVEATEAEINAELESARERAARFIQITDRPVQEGDEVVLDYSGSVDGVKFDGGTAQKQTLVIGSHRFIPGFEEQMIGMTLGETKDLNVKFPDDYHAENLKGKDSVFVVTVHEIKVKELPQLDDEFAKDVSEFDTLDAYKADLEKKIIERKQKVADNKAENDLMELIVKNSQVKVHDCMVENQIDNYLQDFEYSLMYQGLKMEDYVKYTNTTMEQLREQYRERSKKTVETRLVMEAIIKAEKIKADKASIKAKIAEYAKQMDKDVKEFTEQLTPEQNAYLENEVVTDKLLDFLKAENNIV